MSVLLVVVGGLIAGLFLLITSQSGSQQEIGALAQYCEPEPGPPDPDCPPNPCPPNSQAPQCNPDPPNCPPNSQAPQCQPDNPPNCPPNSNAPQCVEGGTDPETGGGGGDPGGPGGGPGGPGGTSTSGLTSSEDGVCVELTPTSAQDPENGLLAPATLIGDEVVPPEGDPDGRGEFIICFSTVQSACYEVAWTNIAAPTEIFIGRAQKGNEGDPVVSLFANSEGAEGTVAHACDDGTEDVFSTGFEDIRTEFADINVDNDAMDVRAAGFGNETIEDRDEAFREVSHRLMRKIANRPSRFFIQINNDEFPDGAIRGQLGYFSDRDPDSEAGV